MGSVPQKNGTFQPYFEELSTILDPIRLNRGDFTARKQLVGMIGPGRSGKSTLINSLVGSEVSPIGQGLETTSRASIVMYSKEPGIEVYFGEKDANEFTPEEVIENVSPFISAIRGFIKREEFEEKTQGLECKALALSSNNLKAALTSKFPKEPLLVIVKTPEWVLKTDQLCFIDFPGLDGFYHNYQKNPNSYVLLGMCDFLILNQSNFCSLDRSMLLFVNKIFHQKEKPLVWFVHNNVEAKSWKPDEEAKEEMEEMVAKTHHMISEELGMNQSEIPVSIINIGKAHDGIFSTRENLFHESQFENFESNFMGKIHSIRLQKLMGTSSEVLERLPNIRSKIQNDESEFENKLGVVKSVEETIRTISIDEKSDASAFGKYGPIGVNQILAHLRSLMQTDIDFAMKSIRELCEKKNGNLPASVVNARVGSLIEQLEETLKGFCWKDVPFLAEQCCKSLDDLSTAAESEALAKANKILTRKGLRELNPVEPWRAEDLPKIPFGGLNWTPVRKTKRLFGLIPWPKSYSFGRIEDYIVYQLFGHLMEQNVTTLDEWRDLVRDTFLRRVNVKRKNTYLSDLGQISNELKKEFDQLRVKCTKSMEVINNVENSLHSMRSVTQSELSALKNKKWSAKM